MEQVKIEPISDWSNEKQIHDWAYLYHNFIKGEGADITEFQIFQDLNKSWKSRKSVVNSDYSIQSTPPTKFLALSKYEKPLGYAYLQYNNSDEEKLPNFCYFFIYVLPNYRRNSIGSKLLQSMKEKIKGYSINNIFTFAEDTVSKKFLLYSNGKITEEGLTLQLTIEEFVINKKKLPFSKPAFTFIIEPNLNDFNRISKTYSLSKQFEPGSETFSKKQKYTGKQLLKMFNSSGNTILLGIMQNQDLILGITILMLSSNFENRIFQRYTGVHPNYFNKGIATNLKSKMYLKIKENYPKIKYIETETVSDNIASIKVNQKLGYKTLREQITFEFKI